MNLTELAKQVPGLTINVSLADLREFTKEVVAETKRELEQAIISDKTEKYLTPESTSEFLQVDLSTLWRWKKKGYLVPIEVGGKRRFRMSDINRILESGKKPGNK
jgi:hypothetical protein